MVGGGLILVLFIVWIVYYLLSKPPVSIEDQDLGIYMNIKSLRLEKPGFLVVDIQNVPGEFVSWSGYLNAGTYKNFSLPVFFNLPLIDSLKTFYRARAFVYEDTDGDRDFDPKKDLFLRSVWGKPLVANFELTNSVVVVHTCSEGLDFSLSSSHLGSTRTQDVIKLVATNNLLTDTATLFYNSQIYSGDLAIQSTLNTFDTLGYGIYEMTMFTTTDRVFSVKLHKENGALYLTPEISKSAQKLNLRHDLNPSLPVTLKIQRLGSEAKVFVSQNSGAFEEIWTIPGVSIENLYVGLEASDVGQIPSQVTVEVSEFSLSCS